MISSLLFSFSLHEPLLPSPPSQCSPSQVDLQWWSRPGQGQAVGRALSPLPLGLTSGSPSSQLGDLRRVREFLQTPVSSSPHLIESL